MKIISMILLCLISIYCATLLSKKQVLTTYNTQPFNNVWNTLTVSGDNAKKSVELLLTTSTEILNEEGIDLIAVYGTLLGAMRHGNIIPWDDDMDFAINADKIDTLVRTKEKLASRGIGLSKVYRVPYDFYKLYWLHEPKIGIYNWSWPFIDIFRYSEDDDNVLLYDESTKVRSIPKKDFYPFRHAILGNQKIIIPFNPDKILSEEYSSDWDEICVSSQYNHKEEKYRNKTWKVKCADLLSDNSNIFNYVWVINLERRPDRWDRTNKRLKNFGIQGQRWDAIDAKNNSFLLYYKNLPDPKRIPAEVACYMSHKKLWQHIYDLGIPYALIFEDDIIIAPSINKKDILTEMNNSKGFDIIYLGHCYSTYSRLQDPLTQIGQALCNHAYIISRSGVERMLQVGNLFSTPVDNMLYDWCENNLCYLSRHINQDNMYGSGLILQDDRIGTDISNKGMYTIE